MYVQAVLKKGNLQTTAWIQKKRGVKVGTQVILKDLNEFWTIESLGTELSDIQFQKMKGFYSKPGVLD